MSLFIIGEAYGAEEERLGKPFVGGAGHVLDRMLADAGIRRGECFVTNVFNFRPYNNRTETLCGPKAGAIPGYPSLNKGASGYVRAEFAEELDRLGDELLSQNPNVVVTLGNTATWALLGKTSIGQMRGYTYMSTHTVEGYKVLPTYHPAAVMREWSLRPTTIMDLRKAKHEATFPELRRPERTIFIPETPEELHELDRTYLSPAAILSVDIETAGTQITTIGFSPDPKIGVVVPFLDPRRAERSYWPDGGTERLVWGVVEDILKRKTPKVFQNGLFDIAFLARAYGIRVCNAEQDTMLLHHALQPEALKGLGYLGSVYTSEQNWKLMRKRATAKKDE